MKHIITILALCALHAAFCAVTPGGSLQPTTPPSGASFNDPPPPPLSAAVPLRWTVETSRAQVAQFEAYRGETLDLEATDQTVALGVGTVSSDSFNGTVTDLDTGWRPDISLIG